MRRRRVWWIAALVVVSVSSCSAPSSISGSSTTTTPARPTSPPTIRPTVTSPAPGPTSAPSRPAGPAHILVLVLENREDNDVLGRADAPYLNSLAARYGVATASFGRAHPSLPNYLDLISGSTWGVTSDCSDCSVTGPTLVGQLQSRGIGWKAYMQSATGPCDRSSNAAGFDTDHDPFVYFTNIVATPALCDRVVPYRELGTDLADGAAPPFLWVTPNVCADGHSCPTATMDAWVRQALAPVLASTWYRDHGRIIITFDEGETDAGCCGVADGGHLATIVVNADLPAGARSTVPVDPAGILRSIEALYGLPYLGEAASAASGSLGDLLS